MTISPARGDRSSENTLLLGLAEVQPSRRDFDCARGCPALEVPGLCHDVPAGTPNACSRTREQLLSHRKQRETREDEHKGFGRNQLRWRAAWLSAPRRRPKPNDVGQRSGQGRDLP